MWLRVWSRLLLSQPQWVIPSRWDEGPTLSPNHRAALRFSARDFSVKQECPGQVGEGNTSSQHTTWIFSPALG